MYLFTADILPIISGSGESDGLFQLNHTNQSIFVLLNIYTCYKEMKVHRGGRNCRLWNKGLLDPSNSWCFVMD
jgi:hypothetical protein